MMARNTGRGSRVAANSPTVSQFRAVKSIGGLFGRRPSRWEALWSLDARRVRRILRDTDRWRP